MRFTWARSLEAANTILPISSAISGPSESGMILSNGKAFVPLPTKEDSSYRNIKNKIGQLILDKFK